MTLVPFKFIVHSVFLEVGDDGKAVGERVAEPVTLYGVEKLTEWALGVNDQVADLQPPAEEPPPKPPAKRRTAKR